jgi:serine/threonine protein kinase
VTYSILHKLGSGAYGVVYLGKNDKTGARVALKTVTNAQYFEWRKTSIAALTEEYEIGARLEHPNFVRMWALIDLGIKKRE